MGGHNKDRRCGQWVGGHSKEGVVNGWEGIARKVWSMGGRVIATKVWSTRGRKMAIEVHVANNTRLEPTWYKGCVIRQV